MKRGICHPSVETIFAGNLNLESLIQMRTVVHQHQSNYYAIVALSLGYHVYPNLVFKGVSNGAPPVRPSGAGDLTGAIVGGKGAHARPVCPCDGLAPPVDVLPDGRYCGVGRTSHSDVPPIFFFF